MSKSGFMEMLLLAPGKWDWTNVSDPSEYHNVWTDTWIYRDKKRGRLLLPQDLKIEKMISFSAKSAKGFFKKIGPRAVTLVYAIGEIALVMVGILLALQVNNWNEDRPKNQESLNRHSPKPSGRTYFEIKKSWTIISYHELAHGL